jgi:hypothetical protein
MSQTKPRGFLATGAQIVRRETPLALYKGLGAVLSGIIPKMAIRFTSFETYKSALADKDTGKTNLGGIFVGEPSPNAHFNIGALTYCRIFSTPYTFVLPSPLQNFVRNKHVMLSWSWCGHNGGCARSDTHGSSQDPTTGTIALAGGSTRSSPIPKCRPCRLSNCH